MLKLAVETLLHLSEVAFLMHLDASSVKIIFLYVHQTYVHDDLPLDELQNLKLFFHSQIVQHYNTCILLCRF